MRLRKGWWALELGQGWQRHAKKHHENLDIVAGYCFLKGSESGQVMPCSHLSMHMLHLEIEAKNPETTSCTRHEPALWALCTQCVWHSTSALLKSRQRLAMQEDLDQLCTLYLLHSSHTAFFTLALHLFFFMFLFQFKVQVVHEFILMKQYRNNKE